MVPQIWTLLTSSFIESDPPELIISVVGVLFTARILESSWGTLPLLQYIAIVAVASGCMLFIASLALYLAAPSLNSQLLYADMAGFHGVLGALLVGIKQALPDKEAKLLSFVKIPSKVRIAVHFASHISLLQYLPGLYLLVCVALGLVLGRVLEVAALVLFAQYAGWWYLRFLQPRQDGSRGDASEEFRFATFFPPVVHAPIDTFAAACSRVLRVFPSARAAPAALPVSTPLGIGGAGLEASRRRYDGGVVPCAQHVLYLAAATHMMMTLPHLSFPFPFLFSFSFLFLSSHHHRLVRVNNNNTCQ